MSVSHFAFPFRFGDDGTVAVVEQSTYEELEQNVKVLVLTQLGERIEVPGFGVLDSTFRTHIDTGAIARAAEAWDNRVKVLVSEGPSFIEKLVRNTLIQTGES